jgi:hypothetical protein
MRPAQGREQGLQQAQVQALQLQAGLLELAVWFQVEQLCILRQTASKGVRQCR